MEKKNNYILGIIGALLGGLLGTIPWILFYVYANMIYSLLAIVVAICSLKGYELFKGKIDNKLPYIIAITSILSITIATLIIIPNLLVLKEVGTMSLANFKMLYENSEFTTAIIGDYIISVLFTFLGIWGVITSIKKQVNNGSEKIDLNYNENKISDEDKEQIKNIFVKYNALDKNNTITKEMLLREIEDETKITYLVSQGIIKVKKGNYYYSEKTEKNRNNKTRNILITLGFILILFGIGIIANTDSDDTDGNIKNVEENREVSYDIPKNYQEYENDYNGWYYVPKKDLSGSSGVIDVSFSESTEPFVDFEYVQSTLTDTFESSNYVIKSMEKYVNNKGNQVLVYVLEFSEYDELIYYVFKDKKYAIIDGFDYHNVENSGIEETVKSIAKNFDWNK